MDLLNFLQSNGSLNITINAEQLIEVINYTIQKSKSEFEQKQTIETYVTRKKAAELLNVTLSTLWRWNKENYLNPVEVGGKRRYKQSDIDRIINGGL